VDKLEILRDELDIDHSAGGVLQVPDIVLALFLSDSAAHFQHVAGDDAGLAPARQHVADHRLDLAAKLGRSRNHAGAGQRHVLPRPGLMLLIFRESVDARRQRSRAS